MSSVTHLTRSVDKILIAKLFAKFRSRYGQLWTSRARVDEDWEFIIEDWLEELSAFSFDQLRLAVKNTFSIYKEYPPTLSQLVDQCLKASGVPDIVTVSRMIANKDFSHPLVKAVYDQIGSWKCANGTEKEINAQVKSHYDHALIEFNTNPEAGWTKLTAFKEERAKALPPPDKIPSPEERKSFKERLADYQKAIDDAKLNCQGEPYREFDAKAINPKSKSFDKKIFDEYKDYLLGIPENKTMILPIAYMYDRTRFINLIEQHEFLREKGYNPTPQGNAFEAPKRNNGPTRIYKNFMAD